MPKKTVLITGASRGIGRSAALAFGAGNWNVAVHYCHERELARQTAEQIESSMTVKADLHSDAEVAAMVDAVKERFGAIDVLVNNAGAARQQLLIDMSEAEWTDLFDVNVHGAFRCIRRILPEMLSRRSGKIINVSSIWGAVGASCEVCYSATKAALIGMTKALAKEVGMCGVQVNCVAPGVIRTDMLAGFNEKELDALAEETALSRLGRPEDVAAALLFLAEESGDFITGQVIHVDGGFCIH